ncbi:MAG TPA: alpha/beta hydrolase [Polyangiaceae bacterium]
MTRSGFTEVSGGRLYYELSGSGDPVVLIHGFTLDRRMWNDLVPRLTERHTVLAYDLRGFGKSSLPVAGEPYAHRDDLRELLDALGLERVHVVGHSVGGHQALEFVLAYPERARTYAGVDVSALGGFSFPAEQNALFAAISEAAKAGDLARARAHFAASRWFAPARENPRLRAEMDAMLESYSGWHWQNTNPQRLLDPPPIARLSEVKCPALVIVGELSLPYNLEIADRLVADIPNARRAVVPRACHMQPMEAPEETARVLLEFWGSLSPAPAP